MATHQKAMDTQIAPIAQQVSNLSRPQSHLPGQPETNPRGHVNAVFGVGEVFEESPMMFLQESVSIPDSIGADVQKEEGKLNSIEKVNPMPPRSSLSSTSTLLSEIGLGQAISA